MTNPSESENNTTQRFDQVKFLTEIGDFIGERNIFFFRDEALAVVKQRVRDLEQQTPVVIIPDQTGIYQGFIHPESRVKVSGHTIGFKLDDLEIYSYLVTSLGRFLNRGASPNSVIMMPHSLTLKEALPYIVFDAVRSYFQSDWADALTETRRDILFDDQIKRYAADPGNTEKHLLSVRDLKDKDAGACVEHAAVTQNLLAVLGEEALMINTLHCQLPKGKRVGHSYNILRRGKREYYLMDTATPAVYTDQFDLKTTALLLYPLTKDQYEQLMDGGDIEITKHNAKDHPTGFSTHPTQLIYSGPDLKRNLRADYERIKKHPEYNPQIEDEWQQLLRKKIGFNINEFKPDKTVILSV